VTSDRELILQLQEDSLEALGELYDRHQRLVYRTALAIIGDREAAADLLQDTFLRLYRFADRVDPNRPLEPWLYRTTANLAYTWVKRHTRWLAPVEDFTEWLVGGKKQSPHLPEMDEEWLDVQHALAAISLSQRIVLVLYYVNDLSVKEIAEIIDVPEGTVKSRLYYGRRALRKKMKAGEAWPSEVRYEYT